jgi:hypothetical protein
MNGCEEVRDLLLSVARGGTVSAPGQRFLREHAESCPDCRRRLVNERMLSAGLAALAAEGPAAPPPAVKAALMAEFRRRQKVAPIRRPVFAWAAAAGVAAALLAAFWVTREHRSETAGTPAPVAVQPRVAVQPPVVVQEAPMPVAVTKTPAPVARTPRRVSVGAKGRPAIPVAAAARQDDSGEVATDFIEIPYTEPLRPEERADVYRVEMPRANMAMFGLPVTGGRLDSRITADVLTGEDGVARAVRFIR